MGAEEWRVGVPGRDDSMLEYQNGSGGYITKEGGVRVPEREERLEHQRGRRVGVTGYQGGRVRVAGREEKLEYRGREGLEYQGCCCLLLLLLLLFRSPVKARR